MILYFEVERMAGRRHTSRKLSSFFWKGWTKL